MPDPTNQTEEPKEAWVVEICVAGREQSGPWRIEIQATEREARTRAQEYNASRPAGYTCRARRYVPDTGQGQSAESASDATEDTGLTMAATLAGKLYRVVKSPDNSDVGHMMIAFTEKDGTRGAVIVLAPDLGNEEIIAAVEAIYDRQDRVAALQSQPAAAGTKEETC